MPQYEEVVQHYGNTAVRRHLLQLDRDILKSRGITDPVEQAKTGALQDFDSVLILTDETLEAEPMHSDSHSLCPSFAP